MGSRHWIWHAGKLYPTQPWKKRITLLTQFRHPGLQETANSRSASSSTSSIPRLHRPGQRAMEQYARPAPKISRRRTVLKAETRTDVDTQLPISFFSAADAAPIYIERTPFTAWLTR